MIYVNSNQQSANKVNLSLIDDDRQVDFSQQKLLPQKYYLVVNLVEMTSVTELVERLRKRVQPKEKTIANSEFKVTSTLFRLSLCVLQYKLSKWMTTKSSQGRRSCR